MTGILMTQVSTPIIGQAAWLLGKIMNGIYWVMSHVFGIQNIGVCIIILTIIIYTLLLPFTIKQQKFSKMSAAMAPEIKKTQKKYGFLHLFVLLKSNNKLTVYDHPTSFADLSVNDKRIEISAGGEVEA